MSRERPITGVEQDITNRLSERDGFHALEKCPNCKIVKPLGIPCVCVVLAKHGHAIHTHTILNEAWKRVQAVPIVKSMHPETRAAIMDAIFRTAPQEPAK